MTKTNATDLPGSAASFGCELSSFGPCGGPLQVHHILSRGKLQNIKGWRHYCEEEHADVFLATVCAAHNVSRIADTKRARAFLLQRRVALFGADYVSGVLDGLRAATKTGMPEWKLEALIGRGDDPDGLDQALDGPFGRSENGRIE